MGTYILEVIDVSWARDVLKPFAVACDCVDKSRIHGIQLSINLTIRTMGLKFPWFVVGQRALAAS